VNSDRRKIIKRILVGVVAAFVIAFAAFSPKLNPFGFVCRSIWYAKRMQIRLLCKTSHHALLEACRELSRRVSRGDLKPGRYRILIDPDPEVSQFPQPILDLRPSYVRIEESGRVMLEMLGGLGHFGVNAYPEDYEKPIPSYKYGDKKLVDGLWYYDDGYHDNPDYHKKIDALLQKGK